MIVGSSPLTNMDDALHLLIHATSRSFPFQQFMWPAFLRCLSPSSVRQNRYETVHLLVSAKRPSGVGQLTTFLESAKTWREPATEAGPRALSFSAWPGLMGSASMSMRTIMHFPKTLATFKHLCRHYLATKTSRCALGQHKMLYSASRELAVI